jgi:hypothetical protein
MCEMNSIQEQEIRDEQTEEALRSHPAYQLGLIEGMKRAARACDDEVGEYWRQAVADCMTSKYSKERYQAYTNIVGKCLEVIRAELEKVNLGG